MLYVCFRTSESRPLIPQLCIIGLTRMATHPSYHLSPSKIKTMAHRMVVMARVQWKAVRMVGIVNTDGLLSRVWSASGTLSMRLVRRKWSTGQVRERWVEGELHSEGVCFILEHYVTFCLMGILGTSGFIAINNADEPWNTRLSTSLPPGRY